MERSPKGHGKVIKRLLKGHQKVPESLNQWNTIKSLGVTTLPTDKGMDTHLRIVISRLSPQCVGLCKK